MPIGQQLTVTIANRPGALARVAQALAARRIQITGLDASGPTRQIRMLVSNPRKAQQALRQARIRARLEEVVVLRLPDRVGALARAVGKLGRRKINIHYGYATTVGGAQRATVVLGVSNPRRAVRALR